MFQSNPSYIVTWGIGFLRLVYVAMVTKYTISEFHIYWQGTDKSFAQVYVR